MVLNATRSALVSVERYATEAMQLFGMLIKHARISRNLTAKALGEKIGVSRQTIRCMEAGDPQVRVGTYFQASALLGVRLFNAELPTLELYLSSKRNELTLLSNVRTAAALVRDDF
jgi:transcriptional regulator with XRE-family HTH domain